MILGGTPWSRTASPRHRARGWTAIAGLRLASVPRHPGAAPRRWPILPPFCPAVQRGGGRAPGRAAGPWRPLPAVDGLRFLGLSQSSTGSFTIMINGRQVTTESKGYTIRLVATREGRFVIPPIPVAAPSTGRTCEG